MEQRQVTMELGNIFRHLLVHNEAFVKKHGCDEVFLLMQGNKLLTLPWLPVPIPAYRGISWNRYFQ